MDDAFFDACGHLLRTIVHSPIAMAVAEGTDRTAADPFVPRVAMTLEIVRRRGFALPLEPFSRMLYGGSSDPAVVLAAVRTMADARVSRGVVHFDGDERLVDEALERARRHPVEAPPFESVARRFARELVDLCPFVEGVWLAGSLGSGGFVAEDDVDVNLVVEDGTKHVAYVAALLVGFRHALRHGRRGADPRAKTPLVQKLVCVNVVWELSETRPFARQDAQLAFELMVSRPLVGAAAYEKCLRTNPGLVAHFPQMAARRPGAVARRKRRPSARLLSWWLSSPKRRLALDNLCYLMASALHAWVRWSRRRNPDARSHASHAEATKHPYAILDRPPRRRVP